MAFDEKLTLDIFEQIKMADIKPRLIKLLKQADATGTMRVTARQFQLILQDLGVDTRPSVTQRIVALLDMDDDGTISKF